MYAEAAEGRAAVEFACAFGSPGWKNVRHVRTSEGKRTYRITFHHQFDGQSFEWMEQKLVVIFHNPQMGRVQVSFVAKLLDLPHESDYCPFPDNRMLLVS